MIKTPLPLPNAAIPPLREAYERTATIRSKYSLEQALTIPALAICLRLYAEAIRRNNGLPL